MCYACSKQNNCKDEGLVYFEKGTGFTKTVHHSRTCLTDGIADSLYKLYYYRITEAQQVNPEITQKFFLTIVGASEKEKEISGYIKFVVLLGNPMSYVKNKTIREFSKYVVRLETNLFMSTITELVKLVETEVDVDM